jgi:AcrR family transcriptional regulator
MKKRVYNSESRNAQAKETRSQILSAAKKLFEKKGFEGVTIEDLASAADVSMPTIYALFKSKRGVLQALIDDSFPAQQFTNIVDSSMRELNPQKRLSLSAKLARKIYDSEKSFMDLIRGASVLSPEFKELEREREERRFERQGEFVKQMVEGKMLAKGITLQKARDILWTLTGRDLYRLLVIERKWSADQYEKWLKELLIKSLLQ